MVEGFRLTTVRPEFARVSLSLMTDGLTVLISNKIFTRTSSHQYDKNPFPFVQ